MRSCSKAAKSAAIGTPSWQRQQRRHINQLPHINELRSLGVHPAVQAAASGAAAVAATARAASTAAARRRIEG
jgi:hypothetical protein